MFYFSSQVVSCILGGFFSTELSGKPLYLVCIIIRMCSVLSHTTYLKPELLNHHATVCYEWLAGGWDVNLGPCFRMGSLKQMKFLSNLSFVRITCLQICSVQFSCSVMSDSLWLHEPQNARPPWPSPTPGVHPNPCPLCRWCHPAISSSVEISSRKLEIPGNISCKDGLNKGQKWYASNRSRRY